MASNPDLSHRTSNAARINGLLVNLWVALEKRSFNHADYGLTSQQNIVLELIISDPQTSPTKLAEVMGVTKGAVSQHLSRLEEQGFISRRKKMGDGRLRVFQLEHQGKAYQHARDQYEGAVLQSYLSALSASDLEEIEAALGKLLCALK